MNFVIASVLFFAASALAAPSYGGGPAYGPAPVPQYSAPAPQYAAPAPSYGPSYGHAPVVSLASNFCCNPQVTKSG